MPAFVEAVLRIYVCEQTAGEAAGGRYELELNYSKAIFEAEKEVTVILRRRAAFGGTPKSHTYYEAKKLEYVGPFALSAEEGTLTVWYKPGGVWTVLTTHTDSTYFDGLSGMESDGDYGLTGGSPHVTKFWASGETAAPALLPLAPAAGTSGGRLRLTIPGRLWPDPANAYGRTSIVQNKILNPSFAHDIGGGPAANWFTTAAHLIAAGATQEVINSPGYPQAGSIFGLESYCVISTEGVVPHEGHRTGEVIPCMGGVPITVFISLREEVEGQVVRLALGSVACGTATTVFAQTASGEWKRHSVTLVPAEDGNIAFSVGTNEVAEAQIRVAAVTTVEPYFDGDTLDAYWGGVRGGSVSTRGGVLRLSVGTQLPLDTASGQSSASLAMGFSLIPLAPAHGISDSSAALSAQTQVLLGSSTGRSGTRIIVIAASKEEREEKEREKEKEREREEKLGPPTLRSSSVRNNAVSGRSLEVALAF